MKRRIIRLTGQSQGSLASQDQLRRNHKRRPQATYAAGPSFTPPSPLSPRPHWLLRLGLAALFGVFDSRNKTNWIHQTDRMTGV